MYIIKEEYTVARGYLQTVGLPEWGLNCQLAGYQRQSPSCTSGKDGSLVAPKVVITIYRV